MKKSKKRKKPVSGDFINSFKEKIEDAFGGHVVSLDSKTLYEGRVLPTGCFTLDVATGIWGLPFSKIIEVHGENGSGKTTLCLHCAKSIQRLGGFVTYIDVEHDLSRRYIEDLGIDLGRFILVQPECAEDALDGAIAALDGHNSDAPMLMVLDSVAALCPRKELEGDMDDQQIALQARLVSKFLRKFRSKLGKAENVIFIMTNQVRNKIGVMWGDPSITPGGKALKFYASVRIKLQHIGFLKDGKKNRYGFRCRATVIKSKVSVPFKTADADVVFGMGFDNRKSIIDAGIEAGIVQKSGAVYSYGDHSIKGIDKLVAQLSVSEFKKIKREIKEYYNE